MPDQPTTARPTYGNWRLPSRPGIGPLGLLGSIVLLGGLIAVLLAALLSWIAALAAVVMVAGVTIPLAIRTTDGRSGFTVAAVKAGWAARRLAGRDTNARWDMDGRP
jgi:hypothetical protein